MDKEHKIDDELVKKLFENGVSTCIDYQSLLYIVCIACVYIDLI